MSWFLLSEAELSALRVSALVALLGVGLSLAPGIACGWLLARREFRGKLLLDALVHLPLVLPPVVTGYLLLLAFGRSGPLGPAFSALGVDVAFTRAAAVIAATVMGFPLLVRAVRLGIQLVDRRVEDAARTLGAGRWRVLFTVTLPLALPGVLTGLVLAFARGLGEFGATITFAGNIEGETRTIPVAVYTFMQQPGGDAAAARLVVIAVVLSFGALIVSEVLARRVYAQLGRDTARGAG